jgi:hypothetical protein
MDQTVLQAIEELRPEYRQALLLSDLEGLSLVEISRRVGIPVGTAKSRIFRARRQARAKLRSHAHAMGISRPGDPMSRVSAPQCGQRIVASVTGSAMRGIYSGLRRHRFDASAVLAGPGLAHAAPTG